MVLKWAEIKLPLPEYWKSILKGQAGDDAYYTGLIVLPLILPFIGGVFCVNIRKEVWLVFQRKLLQ